MADAKHRTRPDPLTARSQGLRCLIVPSQHSVGWRLRGLYSDVLRRPEVSLNTLHLAIAVHCQIELQEGQSSPQPSTRQPRKQDFFSGPATRCASQPRIPSFPTNHCAAEPRPRPRSPSPDPSAII
jgi:hypothetical protein